MDTFLIGDNMAVYIDKLRERKPSETWRWRGSCHLYTDWNNLNELHSLARKLGLKREYFQKGVIPHYDLTRNKRLQAIRLGAVEKEIRAWRREGLD